MLMIPTRLTLPLTESRLCFRLSPDQEYIEATVVLGARTVDLAPRVHLATLHELARARVADARHPGVAAVARGWRYVDSLARALKISEAVLNLHVHRARRQLESAGVEDAFQLIQRRPMTRQLRLGLRHVEFATI